MQKWEYRTEKMGVGGWLISGILDTSAFDSMLNSLGDQGWELISAFDTNQTQGASRKAIAVFKRPK